MKEGHLRKIMKETDFRFSMNCKNCKDNREMLRCLFNLIRLQIIEEGHDLK